MKVFNHKEDVAPQKSERGEERAGQFHKNIEDLGAAVLSLYRPYPVATAPGSDFLLAGLGIDWCHFGPMAACGLV